MPSNSKSASKYIHSEFPKVYGPEIFLLTKSSLPGSKLPEPKKPSEPILRLPEKPVMPIKQSIKPDSGCFGYILFLGVLGVTMLWIGGSEKAGAEPALLGIFLLLTVFVVIIGIIIFNFL